jgi:ribosomal protein L29
MPDKESIKELKRLSVESLQKLLQQKREELRGLRFDLAAGKIKNVRDARAAKKSIAQILTILSQKSHKNI